jgi:hypothetical protein
MAESRSWGLRKVSRLLQAATTFDFQDVALKARVPIDISRVPIDAVWKNRRSSNSQHVLGRRI